MCASRKEREYTRVNDAIKVRVVAHDDSFFDGGIDINISDSINISASGILINTKNEINPYNYVTIIFMKPNSFDFFKGKGKVVRTEKSPDGSFNIAINFIDMSTEDSETLDYYIRLARP